MLSGREEKSGPENSKIQVGPKILNGKSPKDSLGDGHSVSVTLSLFPPTGTGNSNTIVHCIHPTS